MLHRFPKGVDAGGKVHQKRIPSGAPDWIETVRVDFPSGRHADELCVTDLASVLWAVQMSTVEFHPWNSRRADVERPDEWRIDLDPMPDCDLDSVRAVARVAHEVLDELGAAGLAEDVRWRRPAHLRADRARLGLHRRPPGGARLRPRGRAAHSPARRRRPGGARTDRPDKVFVDYNQNARDHTIASAYSVRGVSRGDRVDADRLGRDRRRLTAGADDRDRARPVRPPRRPPPRHRRRALLARRPARMG